MAMLGGLALMGLPVVLHLLMRQKPKRQLFPAFRFLLQRAKTNQRKLRLRHLILLLMRMALVALICVALAALRGHSQVGAIVLVIDTTPSMELSAAGSSRLQEAKQRALEILATCAADSRVAILDTGDLTQQWSSVEEAREKVGKLAINPGGVPITSALSVAYRLFSDQSDNAGAPERRLYVISDRTTNSWDPSRVPDLQAQRERLTGAEVTPLFIDIGVDKPVDIAITQAEVKPSAVPANRDVVIKATVTAIGQDCDTEIICKLTGENAAERKPIKVPAGGSTIVEFVKHKLKPGQYQAEISLATHDSLPADDVRYVTFEVRGARNILTITDEEKYALAWKYAIDVKQDFECKVLSPERIETVEQLKPYLAVCLLSVRNPGEKVADTSLWSKLKEYVAQGGNLLVIPGRDETNIDSYAKEGMAILPGKIEKLVKTEQTNAAKWEPLKRTHPLLAKFATWREQEDVGFLKYARSAWRYWLVEPLAPQNKIVDYNVAGSPPALLERLSDLQRGHGRVLMLTTPLDFGRDESGDLWNDYMSTTVNDGFYVVLANELIAYMVGDSDEPIFNFPSGQAVAIPLPPNARVSEYTLEAPTVAGADTRIIRNPEASELSVNRTNFAGNARVVIGNPPTWSAAFSVNPPSAEFQLERMPADEIEKFLGAGTVVSPAHDQPLSEAIGRRGRQPIDLFPWLTLAFVALLVAESIVANRFYKPEAPENAEVVARA